MFYSFVRLTFGVGSRNVLYYRYVLFVLILAQTGEFIFLRFSKARLMRLSSKSALPFTFTLHNMGSLDNAATAAAAGAAAAEST